MLLTSQDIVRRAGIKALPEYEDVGEMEDVAGFYAFRRYPFGSELSRIATTDGRAALRCYLAFLVFEAPEEGHIYRVEVKA